MGEREEAEVASTLPHRESILEKVRGLEALGVWRYPGIRARSVATRFARGVQPQVFVKKRRSLRTPLNVSDYARVPLLNPDMLVSSWREPSPPLENAYDPAHDPWVRRLPEFTWWKQWKTICAPTRWW